MMRDFRNYLFALQEDLQLMTLADMAEAFISLRDIEPLTSRLRSTLTLSDAEGLTFTFTRPGRAINQPELGDDERTDFDLTSTFASTSFSPFIQSLQQPSIDGAQESIVNSQELAVSICHKLRLQGSCQGAFRRSLEEKLVSASLFFRKGCND